MMNMTNSLLHQQLIQENSTLISLSFSQTGVTDPDLLHQEEGKL